MSKIVELAEQMAIATARVERCVSGSHTTEKYRSLDKELDEARAALQAEVERMEAEIAALRLANKDLQDWYDNLKHDFDALREDAELGRIAMKFVDRAGDVADCDPAERICAEFYDAMSNAVNRIVEARGKQ